MCSFTNADFENIVVFLYSFLIFPFVKHKMPYPCSEALKEQINIRTGQYLGYLVELPSL